MLLTEILQQLYETELTHIKEEINGNNKQIIHNEKQIVSSKNVIEAIKKQIQHNEEDINEFLRKVDIYNEDTNTLEKRYRIIKEELLKLQD